MIGESDLYYWTCSKCGNPGNWTFRPDSKAVKDLDAAMAALVEVERSIPEAVFARHGLSWIRTNLFREKCLCGHPVDTEMRLPMKEDLRELVRTMSWCQE